MLPRGAAKKVTIYLNQDTRAHVEPLWSAILQFLRHKRVAGATLFRADAGFGVHEQLYNAQSEYMAEHASVKIEFIDTPEKTDELLPTLYQMVSDGLIVVQDATIMKAVSKDAELTRATPKTKRRFTNTRAKLVRIYLGEADKWNGEPLYEAIVQKLVLLGFSGATVYRGFLGYGAKGHTHKGGKFHLSHDLPIMISIIEKPERVDELLYAVGDMMQDGIIVTSDVELHQLVPEVPGSGEAGS